MLEYGSIGKLLVARGEGPHPPQPLSWVCLKMFILFIWDFVSWIIFYTDCGFFGILVVNLFQGKYPVWFTIRIVVETGRE